MKKMNRRKFMQRSGAFAGLGLAASLGLKSSTVRAAASSRPNVLFIAVDDLNDCPTPFNPLSGAITPNIARLAKQGVAFQNAFCAAPYCGASRSSVFTGIAPYRSGVVQNHNILAPPFLDAAKQRLGQSRLLTLPAYFQSQNYQTWGAGKNYHAGFLKISDRNYDATSWSDYYEADAWDIARAFPGDRNYRDNRTAQQSALDADGTLPAMIGADYNTLAEENEMPDKKVAAWAVNKLLNNADPSQPFFMALGFYRPHVGMYVPQRFYDLYPLSGIRVPDYRAQIADIEDLPEFALRHLLNMEWSGYGRKMPGGQVSSDTYLLEQMAMKDDRAGDAQAIQAYYASVTFADECLGQVLSALDHSGLRENTIVVLWSDHGWFLGEKLSWQKFKSWEKSSRVPFIISVPNGTAGNNNSVVSLLDLFPTLMELTGGKLPADVANQFDGKSLAPLIDNPSRLDADRFIVGTQTPSGAEASLEHLFHSVRTDRWRYISYPQINGAALSEELYDLRADPEEKKNLLYWQPAAHENVRQALANLLRKKLGKFA